MTQQPVRPCQSRVMPDMHETSQKAHAATGCLGLPPSVWHFVCVAFRSHDTLVGRSEMPHRVCHGSELAVSWERVEPPAPRAWHERECNWEWSLMCIPKRAIGAHSRAVRAYLAKRGHLDEHRT